MSKKKILFLCTGNSCRSQMAEAWGRNLKGTLLESFSAGVNPKGVDPRAVSAMAEVGVDITDQTSKSVEDISHIRFDHVVTVCGNAHQNCPTFPGAKISHIGFDDPPHLALDAADESHAMSHYRRVRDEIRGFVQDLPEVLEAV